MLFLWCTSKWPQNSSPWKFRPHRVYTKVATLQGKYSYKGGGSFAYNHPSGWILPRGWVHLRECLAYFLNRRNPASIQSLINNRTVYSWPQWAYGLICIMHWCSEPVAVIVEQKPLLWCISAHNTPNIQLISTEQLFPLGHWPMRNCVPFVDHDPDSCFTSRLASLPVSTDGRDLLSALIVSSFWSWHRILLVAVIPICQVSTLHHHRFPVSDSRCTNSEMFCICRKFSV